MKKGISLKSILLCGISIFTIIGVFLPWATVSANTGYFSVSYSANGMSGNNGVGDGLFFLIGAVTVMILAGISIFKEKMHLGIKIAISVISAALAALAIEKLVDLGSVPYTTVGFGVYMLLISDIIAAALPWIPIKVMLGGNGAATPEPQAIIATQAPVAPVVPVAPQAPVAPVTPVVTQAPVTPATPVAPAIPAEPVAPQSPVDPNTPQNPPIA